MRIRSAKKRKPQTDGTPCAVQLRFDPDSNQVKLQIIKQPDKKVYRVEKSELQGTTFVKGATVQHNDHLYKYMVVKEDKDGYLEVQKKIDTAYKCEEFPCHGLAELTYKNSNIVDMIIPSTPSDQPTTTPSDQPTNGKIIINFNKYVKHFIRSYDAVNSCEKGISNMLDDVKSFQMPSLSLNKINATKKATGPVYFPARAISKTDVSTLQSLASTHFRWFCDALNELIKKRR